MDDLTIDHTWCLFVGFFLFLLDLELSDFIASSPCLLTRTPGQLLSLTSHLTFGSNEPKFRNRSNLMNAINRQSMKSKSLFLHTNGAATFVLLK